MRTEAQDYKSLLSRNQSYLVGKRQILGKDLTQRQAKRIWKKEYNEMMNEYTKAMDEYHNEVERVNNRILKAIRNMLGVKFYNDVKRWKKNEIEEGIDIGDKWSLVKSPMGTFQEEDWRSFKGVWVKQWSVGYEGDSFAGYIFIQLKEKLFLQIPYSC